jgi:hypothetical protein
MDRVAQFIALGKGTTDDAFRLPDNTGNKRTFKFDFSSILRKRADLRGEGLLTDVEYAAKHAEVIVWI